MHKAPRHSQRRLTPFLHGLLGVTGVRRRPPPADLLRTLLALSVLAPAALSAQDPLTSGDPFESRFEERPNFQIKFRVPERGGEVRLTTKNPVHYEKDLFWEGSEEVVIEYQDVRITADRARYDFPSRTATLEGRVVIDQGPTRLSGSRATFHLESKTGRIENATADLAPTYHVVADSIEKIGEATYRIRHGVFTACDVPDPEWSFSLAEATITLDDYARMKNVSFRAGPVPLLYSPYLIWPTKQDRASGFLVPGVGFNGRRGAYLGLTHYWVTGHSTDLTTQLDLYSKGAIGLGEEFRWAPSSESAGIFQGFFIHDPQATACVPAGEPGAGAEPCSLPDGRLGFYGERTRDRWKVRLDHVSDDLPGGARAVVAIRDYSDEQFLQDYERSFALSSARQILSRAFVTKNSGDDSWNLRLERSETFFGSTLLQQRLPSLEYFRRTSRIGTSPVYVSVESSLSWLFVDRGRNLPHGAYGRADLHPVLSLPWKQIPWLSITARAGGRVTGYTDSTNPQQTSLVGSSRTRSYGEAGLSLVGPSFSRLFDGRLGPYGRFKHVIEPRVDYEYVTDVDDPARIPVYDEVDTALGRNQVRYALVNRLLARSGDPKGAAASEIASFELSQTHALSLPQTTIASTAGFAVPRTGPLQAALRFSPAGGLLLDGRTSYDVDAGRITSTSMTTAWNWKTNFVHATYFASRPVLAAPLPPGSPSPNSDQVRLAAGFDLGRSLHVDTQLNYDARQKLLLEDRSLLTYKGSCYTIFFELRQLRLPPAPRRDYRLVVNLKDIGTLLDVNGSLDSIF